MSSNPTNIQNIESLADAIEDGATTDLTPAARSVKHAELVEAFPILGELARAADAQRAAVAA